MKKIIASFVAIAAITPVIAFAATTVVCVPPAVEDPNNPVIVVHCDNGNPENQVSIWGFTNSQLPHVMPGAFAADKKSLCPAWFAQSKTYCVDISQTIYYLNIK